MKKYLRIALAQINPITGHLSYNRDKIISFIKEAEKNKADIVVFPELALTGYPPEDLLLKKHFIDDSLKELNYICQKVNDIIVYIGTVARQRRWVINNVAAVLQQQQVRAIYRKIELPNYGIFDEKRYFSPGRKFLIVDIDGMRLGTSICGDIWIKKGFVIEKQAQLGARLNINLSASPYYANKIQQRIDLLKEQASRFDTYISYSNLVGGQDEIVFDGGSMVISPKGKIIAAAKQFEEDLLIVDLPREHLKAKIPTAQANYYHVPLELNKKGRSFNKGRIEKFYRKEEEIYQALLLGTRDYIYKTKFQKTVVGLSGGIDSALTATIATDVLGKENVSAVFMPSRYTSTVSREDAYQLASNLGIKITEVSIENIFQKYLQTMRKIWGDVPFDKTEENLQARIRANILMALSNKEDWLVLAPGNKSEIAVGYTTIYGDLVGGFGILKDVYKTLVYKLASFRNKQAGWKIIPERIIKKTPSAELRANQKDTDFLPTYSVLDTILQEYIEKDNSLYRIVENSGLDVKTIMRVIQLVDNNEFKRRQAPPGIRITPKSFGKDRRLPIVDGYRIDFYVQPCEFD
jgi:NAD+ synthase (glutamine-hydrolysing)